MTTKDIIENMEKSFDERFPGDVATMEEDVIHARITSSLYNRDRLKSFIHSYTRTLLESFGEEIMSARREVIGEVEKMRQPHQSVSEYYSGYNKAIDDVLATLKEEEKP